MRSVIATAPYQAASSGSAVMKPESRVVVCFAAQIPLPPVQASNPGSGTRANWDQRVGQRSMPRVNGRIQDIRENTP